jgi:hypothetical protein
VVNPSTDRFRRAGLGACGFPGNMLSALSMKLSEIQQQAMQARMSLIVGAQNFDRLFWELWSRKL